MLKSFLKKLCWYNNQYSKEKLSNFRRLITVYEQLFIASFQQ